MTPKIIELKQAPVVLVELLKEDISYYNIDKYVRKGLEADGYVFKGFLSDLTEEQFAECVERINDKRYIHYPNWTRLYKTAKDSFYSLLEFEKVYTENPFGKKEPQLDDSELWGTPEQDSQVYANLTYRKDKWHEAQSRTIDPKRTVVLIRKEEQ